MEFDYQLVLSARRKTLALHVKNGTLTVRAPTHISKAQIEAFVALKHNWIESKLQLSRQRAPLANQFVHGGVILHAGTEKTLRVDYAQTKTPLIITDDTITITLRRSLIGANQEKLSIALKVQLEAKFKAQVNQYIADKLPIFTEQTQLIPSSYQIKKYKARWGSCNNRKQLSFNYLLAMTPDWVIDYVIVHELCHITHLNHSSDFWSLVRKYLPNYVEAKQWLKDNQARLTWN